MTSPNGAHIHFSRERCKDFSCRDQSYFDLKRSVQKVHWNSRGPSSRSSFDVRVGIRRRRRLSLDFKLLKEPSEWRELCEGAELNEPKDAEELFVRPVSRDAFDGALNSEYVSVLPLELSLR
jgi:hypothetical protein